MAEPNVKDFLPDNVKSGRKTEEIKLKRFKTPFKIRNLMGNEIDTLNKQATKKVFNQRTRMYDVQTDQDKVGRLYLAESVIVPDLNNKELQEAYGTIGEPYQTLARMLTAGELAELTNEVTRFSGLNNQEDSGSVIKAVKN